MSPRIYNYPGHGEIIIQVRDSLLEFAEILIKKFRWAGLIEKSRKRKEIKKTGYTLRDAWEIILKKIPVLEMMDDE
jgi:hypothetical protein